MTGTAWMRHPTLPDHDPIEVVPSQVPHLASGGWVEAEAPEQPEPEPAKTKPSSAGSKPKPTPKDAAASQGGND